MDFLQRTLNRVARILLWGAAGLAGLALLVLGLVAGLLLWLWLRLRGRKAPVALRWPHPRGAGGGAAREVVDVEAREVVESSSRLQGPGPTKPLY